MAVECRETAAVDAFWSTSSAFPKGVMTDQMLSPFGAPSFWSPIATPTTSVKDSDNIWGWCGTSGLGTRYADENSPHSSPAYSPKPKNAFGGATHEASASSEGGSSWFEIRDRESEMNRGASVTTTSYKLPSPSSSSSFTSHASSSSSSSSSNEPDSDPYKRLVEDLMKFNITEQPDFAAALLNQVSQSSLQSHDSSYSKNKNSYSQNTNSYSQSSNYPTASPSYSIPWKQPLPTKASPDPVQQQSQVQPPRQSLLAPLMREEPHHTNSAWQTPADWIPSGASVAPSFNSCPATVSTSSPKQQPQPSDLYTLYGIHQSLAAAAAVSTPLVPPNVWSARAKVLCAKLDECAEEYRQLEKERKQTEAELARHNLGKRISSSNGMPIPRLPTAPSRVDRLVVDFFREHARLVTLLSKMEQLRGTTAPREVHNTLGQLHSSVTVLQQCRLAERAAILQQLRGDCARGALLEDETNQNLTAALVSVLRAATRARAANWCQLIQTIGGPEDVMQAQVLADIIAADYTLPPPPIKQRPILQKKAAVDAP